MKRFLRALGLVAVAFTPIAADLYYKTQISLRPYWIHYFDPEVFYFYSSLNLLQSTSPIHVDHPGTPLQVFGALMLILTPQEPFELDTYRIAIYWLSALLSLLCLSILVSRVTAKPKLSHVCILVWLIYLAPDALEYLTVWAPEMLFPVFSGIMTLSLLAQFNSPANPRLAALSGLFFGIACALKFTYVFCLLSLLGVLAFRPEVGGVSRRSRICLVVAASAAGGFVVATIPILSEYGKMIDFVVSIATRSESYATGKFGLADPRAILDNLLQMLKSAEAWWACLGFIYAVSVLVLRNAKSLSRTDYRTLLLSSLFSLTAVLIAVLISVTIDQAGWRYLLPAMTTAPLVFLALVRANAADNAAPRVVSAAATLILGVLLLKGVLLDLRSHDSRIESNTRLREHVERKLREVADSSSVRVYSYRFPHPVSALRGSAIHALRNPERVLQRLDSAYPGIGAYDPWRNALHLPGDVSDWGLLVLRSDHYAGLPQSFDAAQVGRVQDYVILRKTE